MKFPKNLLSTAILILFIFNSCVTFEHAWEVDVLEKKQSEAEKMLTKAKKLEKTAATKGEIQQIIDTYKDVLRHDKDNYYALWKIGNYNILMGAGHSESKKIQKHYYKEAIKYCEKAMYTNDAFREEIKQGATICEACKKLTANEIDAMGYWYTARFYYFKDCISALGRVFNTNIVMENNKVIERIDAINPEWAGGGNYFSRGIYYIAVPERFGGSKQRADEEFSKAIEIGPNYLVNRWGRAKYLYQITGNKDAFVKDLKWVINQDPKKASNPYPWNVYFQETAKEMLADAGVAVQN